MKPIFTLFLEGGEVFAKLRVGTYVGLWRAHALRWVCELAKPLVECGLMELHLGAGTDQYWKEITTVETNEN